MSPSQHSYPPYFGLTTKKMSDLPTPEKARPALIVWSVGLIAAVLAVLAFMLIRMVPALQHAF